MDGTDGTPAGVADKLDRYFDEPERLARYYDPKDSSGIRGIFGYIKGFYEPLRLGYRYPCELDADGFFKDLGRASAIVGMVAGGARGAGIGGGRPPAGVAAAEGAGARSSGRAAAMAESGVANTEMALVRVGDRLTTVNDVLRNPNLLAGKGPAEIQAILGKTPGWHIETLGKGSHAGQGWVLREYTAAGNPTGRMLRWHPGGGHHGPDPYWRVTGGSDGKSGIILGGPEP